MLLPVSNISVNYDILSLFYVFFDSRCVFEIIKSNSGMSIESRPLFNVDYLNYKVEGLTFLKTESLYKMANRYPVTGC